jgi:Family of unknown function (DUF6130)
LQLAHSLTPGGPDIEVLLVALALLGFGLLLFFQKSTKPYVPVVLVALAFAAGAGAFAIGANSGAQPTAGTVPAPEGLSVAIIAPSNRDSVVANEPFDLIAEVVGGELTTAQQSGDPTRGHLHVFVDDQLISMPNVPTQKVELEPGEHSIVVEFTTADHRSLEPRVTDEIQVTARL